MQRSANPCRVLVQPNSIPMAWWGIVARRSPPVLIAKPLTPSTRFIQSSIATTIIVLVTTPLLRASRTGPRLLLSPTQGTADWHSSSLPAVRSLAKMAECSLCKGSGENGGFICPVCKGNGEQRAHGRGRAARASPTLIKSQLVRPRRQHPHALA